MKKETNLLVIIPVEVMQARFLSIGLKHRDGFTSYILTHDDESVTTFLDRSLTQQVEADCLFNLLVKLNHMGYDFSNPFDITWETLK